MEELYGEHRLYWADSVCATCRQTGRSLMASGIQRHIILLSKQPRVLVVLPLPPLPPPFPAVARSAPEIFNQSFARAVVVL
jgi:hypothetical protein